MTLHKTRKIPEKMDKNSMSKNEIDETLLGKNVRR